MLQENSCKFWVCKNRELCSKVIDLHDTPSAVGYGRGCNGVAQWPVAAAFFSLTCVAIICAVEIDLILDWIRRNYQESSPETQIPTRQLAK